MKNEGEQGSYAQASEKPQQKEEREKIRNPCANTKQRAVAASGTCAERQNGKKKPEGKSPVQKMRGPGLESGTKQTQNRPKWLLEEERVPGVGCETFFREEKQQKRPKCREEIERIDLCDWGKPTFLGKSPNWRLEDLVYQNIPKPTKDWSKRSYKNTMGGDGSFRRGQESEKQRMFPAANVLEKNHVRGKPDVPIA